ncbi:MAG: DUF3253 domain-containing protein [Asticcacaulis sp.]|uniref:DUF3253 domain-containing protein n=1 Tax=Asticcacaulis sp. TaxID=1872648 RepID=UPI003F7C2789
MSQLIEETIAALLSQVREGESISPNDVAKLLNPEGWRRELPKIRAVIVGMTRQGRLEMLRKGRATEPEEVRGIYRIRKPLAEE